MPGAGNRGGSLAGVFRPLLAGPSGSAVSPRLSGGTARPGICRPSPAPPPCSPGTDCQWPPLSPSPRPPQRRCSPGCSPQVHQPQLQLRRPEVLPHRFPTPELVEGDRRIVPDDPPRPGMLFLQLRQAVASGSCVRQATEVPLLLLPSSSIHSTSPVCRHTAQ